MRSQRKPDIVYEYLPTYVVFDGISYGLCESYTNSCVLLTTLIVQRIHVSRQLGTK